MLLLSPADFFQNQNFSRNSFRKTIIVSNSLDPDQAPQCIVPDLGANCLQRSDSRRKKVTYSKKRVKYDLQF